MRDGVQCIRLALGINDGSAGDKTTGRYDNAISDDGIGRNIGTSPDDRVKYDRIETDKDMVPYSAGPMNKTAVSARLELIVGFHFYPSIQLYMGYKIEYG